MARPSGGVTRKPSDATTAIEADIQATASNHSELVAAGGPTAFARAAAETAARKTFEFWLDVLERIDQDELDEQDQMFCALYIRSLRRRLGVPQSKEEAREQTRLRVKRFRERARKLN